MATKFKEKISLIMLGVFLFFIILELVLRLIGFIFLKLQENRNILAIKQKSSFHILCLGESTTLMGKEKFKQHHTYISDKLNPLTNLSGDEYSYPYLLEEILNKYDIGIKFTVINKGSLGVNTSYILSKTEKYFDEYKPDMVIVMMGINDNKKRTPYINNFENKKFDFKSLRVNKLINLIYYHLTSKNLGNNSNYEYNGYSDITIQNYKKMKKIADAGKIKLVCAQYPMRSIDPLERIFKINENIIFVDNEKVFKNAVEKDGYNEYFIDIFAGDFGHCTYKGNKLLAENIAKNILEKYFSIGVK